MKCAIRSIIRDWVPPIVRKTVNRIFTSRNVYTGDYNSWGEASSLCVGYNDERILTKALDSTLRVQSGEAVFERDSVLFDEIQYSWPLLSGLMLGAAKNSGKVSVLDFGGSLGSSYFQCQKFLSELPEVEWAVVEQRNFVKVGKVHISSKEISFFETIDECGASLRPNVALLSSTLQYIQDPVAVLQKVSLLDVNTIIIDRTPFSFDNKAAIVIQHVPPEIYPASYPMHILLEEDLLRVLGQEWRVVERFISPEGFDLSSEGHKFTFNSLILARV